jgi:hypothetical protein
MPELPVFRGYAAACRRSALYGFMKGLGFGEFDFVLSGQNAP